MIRFLFISVLCYSAANCVQDIGWIWHVTDFHYDFSYWTDKYSCHEKLSSPGIYGDYWCDSPWLLVKDSIESMKTTRPDVDFILWTGDNVAHIKDADLTIDLNVEVFKNITDYLKAAFPDIPTYATLGNHDYLPSGQFPAVANNDELYRRVGDMWKDWINDTTGLETFKKGGYYSVKTKHGLRIIGLNTNLYYTSDKQTANATDPSGQFAWLEEQLNASKTNDEKVFITAHVPPGIHTPSNVLWFYEHFNNKFIEIINKYVDSNIIKGMYYGHNHADGFKVFYKTDGTPGFPLFMAPSVTPWRYKIPQVTGPPHNPGIRLISYDRNTGQPINILMYYIDLPDSNMNNKTDWKLEYNFTRDYQVKDVTAASVDELIKKMHRDTSFLDKYFVYKDVSTQTADDCDTNCKNSILCGFTKYRMNEFNTCKQGFVNGANTLVTSHYFTLYVFECVILIISFIHM